MNTKNNPQTRRQIRILGPLLGLVISLSSPVSALTIMAGSDYLETAPGTFLDFGFPGSPVPGVGIVDFVGDPFGPGNTDTIVRRLEDADLPTAGSSDTIDIELVALSLVSVAPVNIGGTDFDLSVSLTPAAPSAGEMTITLDDASAVTGTFTSFFDVFFEVELFLAGTDTLFQTITGLPPLHLEGSGQWGKDPPPNAVIVPGPLGDLDANWHDGPPPMHHDFFIFGEVVEEHPGIGVHRARTATDPIPEPATMTLLGLGLAGLLARSRNQKS